MMNEKYEKEEKIIIETALKIYESYLHSELSKFNLDVVSNALDVELKKVVKLLGDL